MPSASGFEPQPLGRRERAGKARIGRPGSQETSLRPEGRSPRGKGWLISVHKLFTGLWAGLVLLAAAPAAHAANVSVRVEGAGDTLVPRTTVGTSAGTFTKDGDATHACSPPSAAGALERATGVDWSGTWLSFGDYQIKTIKG